MKTSSIRKAFQYVLLVAIIVWGTFSFLLLMGDDVLNPIPLMDFLVLKAGAIISCALCYLTYKSLSKAGYLPNSKK